MWRDRTDDCNNHVAGIRHTADAGIRLVLLRAIRQEAEALTQAAKTVDLRERHEALATTARRLLQRRAAVGNLQICRSGGRCRHDAYQPTQGILCASLDAIS